MEAPREQSPDPISIPLPCRWCLENAVHTHGMTCGSSAATISALWDWETKTIHQGHLATGPMNLVGTAAVSKAAGAAGCTPCMVPASLSLVPLGLQPPCQG